MSNKCLVTQLKASCSDMENPIYFGKAEMLVEVTQYAQLNFLHVNNKPVEIELIEGDSASFSINNLGAKSFLSKKGNKIIINRSSEQIVSNSNDANFYPLMFSKKGVYKLRYDKYTFAPYVMSYNISTLIYTEDIIYREDGLYQTFGENFGTGFTGELSNLLKVTPNDAQYFKLFSKIDGKYYSVNGNLQEILNKLTSLSKLALSVQFNIEGNINNFSTYTGKSNITEINLGNCSKLTGDIVTAFADCTSLTSVYLENLSQVKGSIAELAQAQVDNGRTSGTLLVRGYAIQVVPNPGSTGKTITFTESGYTIS